MATRCNQSQKNTYKSELFYVIEWLYYLTKSLLKLFQRFKLFEIINVEMFI